MDSSPRIHTHADLLGRYNPDRGVKGWCSKYLALLWGKESNTSDKKYLKRTESWTGIFLSWYLLTNSGRRKCSLAAKRRAIPKNWPKGDWRERNVNAYTLPFPLQFLLNFYGKSYNCLFHLINILARTIVTITVV